jgi:subtilase family serine protease
MAGRASRRGVSQRSILALTATTAIAVGMVAFAGTAGAVAAPGDTAFPNSVPAWATPKADAGAADPNTTVEGEVFLPLKDEAGAQALALAISTPGNPRYNKPLTAAQWISTYSPSQADFNAVKAYLVSSGVTIYATPASRQYIVFRAPISTMAAAFKTKLHNYHYAGGIQRAPASAPELPTSIASKVSAISIDSSRTMTTPDNVRLDSAPATATPKTKVAPSATPSATPVPTYTCSVYYGQVVGTTPPAYGGKTSYPTANCGYIPDQLRSGYGLNKLINSGNSGAGQTVAIIDAYGSPSILQDTNDYMLSVGSPLLTKYTEIKPAVKDYVDTAACQGVSGWQGEQAIDVQSAHSIAPGASILYVGGFNCGGGLDIALSKILDGHLANIVSNSYGDAGEAVPSGTVAGEQDLHIQAAAEGIGLYFSSGDSGDEQADVGYITPDFPASSPFVTAVGGTSVEVGANGAPLFSTGWGSTRDQIVQTKAGGLAFAETLPGTIFRGGAGGGVSALFAQPAYQKGVVPTALADSDDGTPSRVVPDISALADPYTGFQIEIRPYDDDNGTQGPLTAETYGGTSLASPIIAAMMALTQQATGRVIGFANPALYALDKAAPSAFQDILPNPASGSSVKAVTFTSSLGSFLVTLGRDTSLKVSKGYDEVTGIGTPQVGLLSQYLTGK